MTAGNAPWFERWPDLAAWEIARFRANGLPARVDEGARRAGRFVVLTEVEFLGQACPLTVRYPAETPELPPEVYAEPGLLERHQHVFQGNLCLLERPLDDWPAGSWGAADLIVERVTALLNDSATGPDAVRANEAPIPEPHSAYFSYAMGPVVIVPGNLVSPGSNEGTFKLRPFDPRGFRFVLELVDGDLGDPAVVKIFPPASALTGRWKRLSAPPEVGDGPAMAEWLRREHPGLLRPVRIARPTPTKRLPASSPEIAAVVFDEEGPGVGESRPAWLFLCLAQGHEPFLMHSQIASTDERFRRIPGLTGLRFKRALVIGAGTLGSEIAVGLARAGLGTLGVVDHDRFEINNAVRHVLGVEWTGVPKALAVATTCRRANPFCEADWHDVHLGQAVWEGPSSVEVLKPLVVNADVVIETTGSHQIQRFIARMAQEAARPFVSCWLTEGFWGGELVRIIPRRTCSFVCFATAHALRSLPRAPAGPDAPVTAQGCSHPTVSGAGFDASEAVSATTRLVVQTLLGSDGHADAEWDYAALDLRGIHLAAGVQRQRLTACEDCRRCDAAGSDAKPS